MTRTILDAQIHEISSGVIQLGTLVGTALDHALQAFCHSRTRRRQDRRL